MAHLVKNLPAVQETWVRSLGWEDPLEKGKATHSILYHWSICVFVFCYYTLLITVGLWDFIFLGSQITADGDCSHEIKRRLLLGRKLMTNLDSILKSRDITLPTKFSLVKAMVFQWSCMDVRVGLWRRLSTKESMLLNCGVGEDSWESLGLQEDATSPF